MFFKDTRAWLEDSDSQIDGIVRNVNECADFNIHCLIARKQRKLEDVAAMNSKC